MPRCRKRASEPIRRGTLKPSLSVASIAVRVVMSSLQKCATVFKPARQNCAESLFSVFAVGITACTVTDCTNDDLLTQITPNSNDQSIAVPGI